MSRSRASRGPTILSNSEAAIASPLALAIAIQSFMAFS
jgi:hypothetical protein